MSLYREMGRTRPAKLALIAVAGLLAGGAVGFALGKAANEEPSLRDSVQALQADLRPALGALELVTIEYPEAVRDGRVVARTEYAAVRSQLEAASRPIADFEADLALLDPGATRTLRSDLERLRALIDAKAQPSAVTRQSEALALGLRRIARLDRAAQ